MNDAVVLFGNLVFQPILPWPLVAALSVLAMAALGLGLRYRLRGGWWRAVEKRPRPWLWTFQALAVVALLLIVLVGGASRLPSAAWATAYR